MSTYQVKAVTSKREFESKYGPLMSYKVQLVGDDGFEGEAEITQKPTTTAPAKGQVIEGTLDKSNPKYPPKLKKAQGAGGGRPGGGARAPKDTDSIERQVAYKGAVELAVAFGSNPEEGRQLLPEFFALSIALIQDKKEVSPAETVKAVFPGAKEVDDTQAKEAFGKVFPTGPKPEIDREALINAYKGWVNVMTATEHSDEEIAKTFETKKTALGIGNMDDATAEQRAELHEYLTSV